MKNLKSFAISTAGIISFMGTALVLFFISSTYHADRMSKFEVVSSNVTISGEANTDKWQMLTTDIFSSGQFEQKDNELLSISNFVFSVPVKQLRSDNHQFEALLQDIFAKNACTQFTFKQEHQMILPIMKKANVSGYFDMVNGAHSISIFLDYELNENRYLRLRGKRSLNLSEFGIKIPAYLTGAINDEITLEIDFVLANRKEDLVARVN